MPELPEVETVVRQLDKVLAGKVIGMVEVLRTKSFQGDPAKLVGQRINTVGRKQKIIVIELGAGHEAQGTSDLVILIHLKMTGQLIYVARDPRDESRVVGGHPTADWVGDLPSKHTRVILRFRDGSTLYFNDQRVFGWLKVVTQEVWEETRVQMPPDVIDKAFTVTYLTEALGKSSRAVKLVILDQDKFGGMGNIYANDALYMAQIHPLRKANSLKPKEIHKLHEAMVTALSIGIETGGASYSHFVDTRGLGGHYQEHFLVYDQEGKPCKRCAGVIEKISIGGRGTYFCPSCQK